MKKLARKSLSILFSVLFLSFLILFFAGQNFDSDNIFLGGPKYLVVYDNFLQLSLNKKVKTIDMYFKNPVNNIINMSAFEYKGGGFDRIVFEKFDYSLSNDKKLLLFNLKDVEPKILKLEFVFEGFGKGNIPAEIFIREIDIDNVRFGITNIWKNYLNKNDSNLHYFKSLKYENLSVYLAETYGSWILISIVTFLLSLCFFQLFIVFATIIYAFFKDFKIGKYATFPINIIDYLSENYAVVLGFLGTILSVWMSLEKSNLDYSNFFEILSIVKMAVFTTVLGLIARVLFGIREFVYSLKNGELKNSEAEES